MKSKLFILIIMGFLVTGCSQVTTDPVNNKEPEIVTDPLTYGDYYVTNTRDVQIVLSAKTVYIKNEVDLINNIIEPGEKTLIYIFAEGSGGHVRPSNAFSEFTVYSSLISEDNIIYTGVNNQDWVDDGFSDDRHYLYNLTIN